MRRFSLVADLETEQKTVLNLCTQPHSPNEFIVVQGVAGSGKTTIALHSMEKLGELGVSRFPSDRPSLLMLTYNRRLAEYCANTLRDQPIFAKSELMAEAGSLTRGGVNVLSFQDVCGLILTDQERGVVVDDKECIVQLGHIARSRGVRDLLPSQIFALITTFLRGRPELLGLGYEELDAQITAEMKRSTSYRMYGESLRTVRRFVLQSYDDWKRDRLDRSDIATRLRSSLILAEANLCSLKGMTAKEIRAASGRVLGDRDENISAVMDWLRKSMEGYKACAAIEAQARLYADLLNGKNLSQSELESLRKDLLSWIRLYGLRGSRIWENLASRLSNPLIMVDELQDLSAIESEALIALWFQLARGGDSRLVLFGDLNQQMSPSGFEWEQILGHLRKRAEIYENPSPDYFSQGFTDDQLNARHPFRLLDNNYRTTPQIACLARQLVQQVAQHSLEPEIAHKYLKHTIDPDRTVPYNLADKLKGIPDTELLPRILVGDNELFLEALSKHVAEIGVSTDASAVQNEMLATVIITEHPDTLESFVQSEETRAALSLISYIPTLSCKGLEFDSCIVFGISTKETDQLEADMLARWYTSFTRAKMKLFVYLSATEFDYLKRAGWTNIPADVALVQHASEVSTVLKALRWAGTTELGEEEFKLLGEINLARFLRHHDERFIAESLRHFENGLWISERNDAAVEAASYFELQGDFLKAADYYEIAENAIGTVRALEAHCGQLAGQSMGSEEVGHLRARAYKAIGALSADSRYTRAQCYLELQEWEKALQSARGATEAERHQVGEAVLSAMRLQLRRGMTTRPTELPASLERYGFFDQASMGWAELGAWDRALPAAAKSSAVTRGRVLEMAVMQAKNRELPPAIRRTIARQLEENRDYRAAAVAFKTLGEYESAVRCYLKANDIDAARELVADPTSPERAGSLRLIADALYAQGRKQWPEAFANYHAAGLSDRANEISKRCEIEQEYVLLAHCYWLIGDLESARAVANSRQMQDANSEAEVAAMCWSVTGDSRDAAECWMRAYYRELESCEMVLGPNPNEKALHRATFQRCAEHLRARREAYGISEQTMKRLIESAAQSEEASRTALENLISIASLSQGWQDDVRSYHSRLENSLRRTDIALPDRLPKLVVPKVERELNSADLARLWAACQPRFVLFRNRAEAIAGTLYTTGENRVVAIEILANVCHDEREARRLADECGKRSDIESRRVWIRSWRVLGRREDAVLASLETFDPISDSGLTLEAIDDYFRDDLKAREVARARYRERLSQSRSPKAKQLLKEIFGLEPEVATEKTRARKSLRVRGPNVYQLLEDLVREVSAANIDEEDLADFKQQIERISLHPEETDRLAKRWEKAKKLLPEIDAATTKLVSTIDGRIDRILSEAESEPSVEPGPARVESLPRPEATIGAPVGEPIPTSREPESETAPDNQESVRAGASGSEGDSAQVGSSTPSHAGPSEGRRTVNASRPRRSRKSIVSPGGFAKLDLHEMNVSDALNQVRGEMERIVGDPTIRCLLIVHGYGKDRGTSQIRGEVRALLKRDWVRHPRVTEVLNGERLDNFDSRFIAIREACPELTSQELGPKNAGITVVRLTAG